MSYAFSQLPAGILVDRIGPRILLGVGLVIWSVAQGAAGLVTSYAQFFAARIGLGVGESPQFPTGARVVSNWFHVKERGFPTGIFNSAPSLALQL
jgi:MFS family permease